MALASQNENNVQWTVTNKGKNASGGNSYELREVATGKTEDVQTEGESDKVIDTLIHDYSDMLKRLADR